MPRPAHRYKLYRFTAVTGEPLLLVAFVLAALSGPPVAFQICAWVAVALTAPNVAVVWHAAFQDRRERLDAQTQVEDDPWLNSDPWKDQDA